MVGILEVGKMAFESYRKDIVAAIIFVLLHILAILVSIIPIIGAVAGAYVFPRVLGWYYNKAIGNINPNYKLSFKIWLIRLLAIHLGILLLFGGALYAVLAGIPNLVGAGGALTIGILVSTILGAIFNIFLIAIVFLVVLIVLELILYYQAYAAILGKIDKIEASTRVVKNSIKIIVYLIVWSIILEIIGAILRAIPVVGGILALIYTLFVFIPILNLIIAHKALSM
ncbi:MAG: hypothetical protein QXR54_00025 [Nanopusillaceae archaeon]